MHFFYLDESGDTGGDLNTPDQPIMILGGVNLRDEGWNITHTEFNKIIKRWFDGPLPDDFELHAGDLLSRLGRKHFYGYSMEKRTSLALDLLKLLDERNHGVHLVTIDKSKVARTPCGLSLDFNPSRPYLLAFDYLITCINWKVKGKLGQSARAMIILDRKRCYEKDIEKITRCRRFEGPLTHRTKWICEFSYPVDSKKNSMVQLSDLIILCAKRFLEIEHNYRPNWPNEAKHFYAKCYSIIYEHLIRKTLVPREGRNLVRLNEYLNTICLFPKRQWKRRYNIQNETSGARRSQAPIE